MLRLRLWLFPTLGWIMIGHFIFSTCRCLYIGTPEDVLWISHIGTLIGGVGACLRNRRLISVALVACFGHHIFWIFDTLVWLVTGKFAIGTTFYLQNATLGAWFQSANHFFTVPSLLILALLQGEIEKYAWIWSAVLFSCLVLISLVFLPPTSNVNCAHRPWNGLETIVSNFPGLDPFSLGRYLLFVITITIFTNYLPTNLILGYCISKC